MKITFTIFIVTAAFIISGFTFFQTDTWIVPAKSAKTPNPVKSNAESISEGKIVWNQYCSSCHGRTGLGDGIKAMQLKSKSVDFSLPAFQSQPDGSLFYKISEGRNEMPGFKKMIPEQKDIWNLINFVRSLKK